jgi:hypothetical protein
MPADARVPRDLAERLERRAREKEIEGRARLKEESRALYQELEAQILMQLRCQARSGYIHWFPYDPVGVVNADP